MSARTYGLTRLALSPPPQAARKLVGPKRKRALRAGQARGQDAPRRLSAEDEILCAAERALVKPDVGLPDRMSAGRTSAPSVEEGVRGRSGRTDVDGEAEIPGQSRAARVGQARAGRQEASGSARRLSSRRARERRTDVWPSNAAISFHSCAGLSSCRAGRGRGRERGKARRVSRAPRGGTH